MTETTLGHYTLGVAGLALLRGWYGADGHDARQRLITMVGAAESDNFLQLPLPTPELDVIEGYSAWAESYDGPNPMIEIEETLVNPLLGDLVEGVGGGDVVAGSGRCRALDVGCGTGRKAGTLLGLGCEVTGVDLTPAMLDVARESHPSAEFREGTFEALPVDDASVDLVVSGLAVCHAVDLEPVFAEMARVLRPGGVILIADPHPTSTLLGGQAFFFDDATMPFVRNQGNNISTYLDAIREAGLSFDRMWEAPVNDNILRANPVWASYPHELEAALGGTPFLLAIQASRPTR